MTTKTYCIRVKGSKDVIYIEAESYKEVEFRPGDMQFYKGEELVGEARNVEAWWID